MFHFPCKELLPFRRCRFAQVIDPHVLQNPSLKSRSTHVCSFLPSPSPKPITHPSDTTIPPSLTVSYLINSCGLSSEEALSASQKVQLKTREKPDSVLEFLKARGFTNTQCARVIAKCPKLLVSNPEKTLKPKWDFLQTVGFSSSILADLFARNPVLFTRSLEKNLIPSIDFLKSLSYTAGDIANALKLSNNLFLREHNPNCKTLREFGVPDSNTAKLIVTRPRALLRSADKFRDIVSEVKELGLDPSSVTFVHAVGVVCSMNKATWERKWALYRSLGWSDVEISTAFRKQPYCFGLSDEHIKQKLDFFMNKLGWPAAFISNAPFVLLSSFERKLLPRFSVLNILMARGLIKRSAGIVRILKMTQKDFLEKYVIKYEKEVPQVVKASLGQVAFEGWDFPPEKSSALQPRVDPSQHLA